MQQKLPPQQRKVEHISDHISVDHNCCVRTQAGLDAETRNLRHFRSRHAAEASSTATIWLPSLFKNSVSHVDGSTTHAQTSKTTLNRFVAWSFHHFDLPFITIPLTLFFVSISVKRFVRHDVSLYNYLSS